MFAKQKEKELRTLSKGKRTEERSQERNGIFLTHQQLDTVHVTAHRTQHERRPSVILVLCIRVGAFIKELLQSFDFTLGSSFAEGPCCAACRAISHATGRVTHA